MSKRMFGAGLLLAVVMLIGVGWLAWPTVMMGWFLDAIRQGDVQSAETLVVGDHRLTSLGTAEQWVRARIVVDRLSVQQLLRRERSFSIELPYPVIAPEPGAVGMDYVIAFRVEDGAVQIYHWSS